MTYANIRRAAEHIACTGAISPQQLAAFSGLWESMTDAQKQAFTDLWRAEGSPAVEVKKGVEELLRLTDAEITAAVNTAIGEYGGLDPRGRTDVFANILARSRSPQYPSNLVDVVTQPGQYAPNFGRSRSQVTNPNLYGRARFEQVRSELTNLQMLAQSIQDVDSRLYFKGISQQGNMVPGVDFLRARDQNFFHGPGRSDPGRNPQITSELLGELGGSDAIVVAARPRQVSHITLTKTGRVDSRGLHLMKLQMVVYGSPMEHLLVVSGAPGRQSFRTGRDSVAGSLEPIPEGRWSVENIAWKAGRDNYNASWGEGLGPASVPLNYQAPGTTRRSAIEIHYDENHGYSPGTAGCIGIRSIADLKSLVAMLRAHDPKQLFVDWGLGTCPKPV